MDIPWEDVRLFLAVAEAGSVSGAARLLGLGQPTISRRLSELEETVGARLFQRTVEGAKLTSAGERLLPPAKKMAEWAGEVGRAADADERAPGGLVRITASPFTCFDFVAPFAAWVSSRHPTIRIELLSTTRYLDMARGEADLAIRLGRPRGKDLEVLTEVEYENAGFVSAALAKKLPKAPHPKDVPWIGWAPPFEDLPPQPLLEALIPGFMPAFTSDSILVNLAAAEAGVGAILLARVTHPFSVTRHLVPLDLDLGPARRGTLCLVCPKTSLDIPRVRLVAELLREQMEKIRGR
ncbi:MAG TPA: LysR family transcriptional regulator [Polyangiaceae bacterium]|nr:LysR family transcriptional regulator [Polyangiaceae bacterium]